MNIDKLDAFTRQYMETALWSSNDESNEQGGEPFDANYDITDLAPCAVKQMQADCDAFQEKYGELYDDSSQAGHDFWLTRCGHGAGFWDGDYPEPQATKLTEASKSFGESNLYLGDNGIIYLY